MYFDAVQWIRDGGALPPTSHETLAALTQTTYTFQGDKILLEPKDDIKEKLGYSPDEADALVLTFAEAVTVRPILQRKPKRDTDYNPYREVDSAPSVVYNPYR